MGREELSACLVGETWIDVASRSTWNAMSSMPTMEDVPLRLSRHGLWITLSAGMGPLVLSLASRFLRGCGGEDSPNARPSRVELRKPARRKKKEAEDDRDGPFNVLHG